MQDGYVRIIGCCDLLPKLGFVDAPAAPTDEPVHVFWGLYLIVSAPNRIPPRFAVVDCFTAAGNVLLVKDTDVVRPIVINRGPCPALHSVAATQPEAYWYHAGLTGDRSRIGETCHDLASFCTAAVMVLGVRPLYGLMLAIDPTVTTEAGVYSAIDRAMAKRATSRPTADRDMSPVRAQPLELLQ